MNEKFDVLIIFIDGTQLEIPNVVDYFTNSNEDPLWRLSHETYYTFLLKSQVRLIGRKKDLEGCV